MATNTRIGIGGAYGRMGEAVRRVAETDTYDEVSVETLFDREAPVTAYDGDLQEEIDVYIDFTEADAVRDNVEAASRYGVDTVIGTTGWYDQADAVDDIADEYGQRVLYGANFSPEVNALFATVESAAQRLDGDAWDAGIVETHHTGKDDAPSGTALTLYDILDNHLWEDSPAAEDKVGSVRLGDVPGEHEIRFINTATGEEQVYTHAASGTEDFAGGALDAARWVHENQDRAPGLYTFQDTVVRT